MNLSRPNQCRRSTAVGPGMDRLRYPGRGCAAGTSSRPSSLTSFARGAWVRLGHLGSADDWVETSSRNDFKCWTEVDEYLPT
ncbi:hypothetical protein THAOC_10279, partial [Thalassiosira oceanica]